MSLEDSVAREQRAGAQIVDVQPASAGERSLHGDMRVVVQFIHVRQIVRDKDVRLLAVTESFDINCANDADFESADEIFSTGNYSKVAPVTRIDVRSIPIGPCYTKARELYWAFAHA